MASVLRPPSMEELKARVLADPKAMSRVFPLMTSSRGLVNGKYEHWDTLFRLRPPEGIRHEEWWMGIKLARNSAARPLPLRSLGSGHFTFNLIDEVISMLHQIDQKASGSIQISDRVTSPGVRDRYVINSLIEEAITSSQLEGASTTRKVAKEMLRSGRAPRDRSERMILNNYLAMRRVRELTGQQLTPDMIFELHRIVTAGTLDDPRAAGRLQSPEDDRVGVYDAQDRLVHLPPPAAESASRLEQLCAFANGNADTDAFVHPVVRAIVLHFMVGYIHPFEDGNGRTARALFYWSMLSQGYWLTEFLTISAILKQAPAKYGEAFQFTETDENDLTYFLVYQLRVIIRAIKELHEYLDRKINEVQVAERLARRRGLNHRQLALIGHAMRNVDADYTIRSHAASHGVVYQTARSDLFGLAAMGLLEVARIRRADHFSAPTDLVERLSAE